MALLVSSPCQEHTGYTIGVLESRWTMPQGFGKVASPSIAKCSPCNGHAARSDFGAIWENASYARSKKRWYYYA